MFMMFILSLLLNCVVFCSTTYNGEFQLAGKDYLQKNNEMFDLLQKLTKGLPLSTKFGPPYDNDTNLPDVDNIIPVFKSPVSSQQPISVPESFANAEQTTKATVPPGDIATCQKRGCEPGSACVFENSLICTEEQGDVLCQCRKGCRNQHIFIPLGTSSIVDKCGSKCFCDLFREVHCTQVPCS